MSGEIFSPKNELSPAPNKTRPIAKRNIVLRLSGCLIGGLLLFSSLTHLMNPYDFAFRVLEYQMLGRQASTLFAAELTFVQLAVATALIWDIARSGAWLLSSAMFSMFAIAQLISLLRGLEIDCGCFGYLSHNISWLSVSGAFAGAIISLACFVWICRQATKGIPNFGNENV